LAQLRKSETPTKEINVNLTKKQSVAWEYLADKNTNELLFGGSAGGGKSMLGCIWITSMCIQYPGTRWLIGRTVLTQLRLTTLRTMFDVFTMMGLSNEKHYNYNAQSNIITFYNKSEVILKDLELKPSDPHFDSLGSLEITGGFLDEVSQMTQMAYTIVKSRIRYKLNEYNLIPKLLLTCNPSNTWSKKEFYLPYIQDTLEENKKFIPSLPLDNPHLPPSYIETLRSLPELQRRRLLEGDWDFLDSSDNLFNFESITGSVFKFIPNENDKKYLTLDVARFGDDRSVAVIWVGKCITEVFVYTKLDATQLVSHVKELMAKYGIHPLNVIVDSDGVGGPVADMLRGTNFVNNARALHDQNFINLKSQCYVKLAEMLDAGEISINILNPMIVDELTQELLSIKLKDVDKDTKVSVMSKDQIKKMIGKSPDLADALMMGMLPHIKSLKATGRYGIGIIR
jgi:phage terminase large subunit